MPISTCACSFQRCLFLLSVFLIASCAGTRDTATPKPDLPEGFPYHSAAEIFENIRSTSAGLHAFSGRAAFSVSTPEQSGRFSASISARQNDSLYLSISPGFGIEAARVLVTPDSFYLYDRIHNELSFGSAHTAGGMLGFPVGNSDLFQNLLGIIFPAPEADWTITANDSSYVVTDARGSRGYTIDPSFWRVVRYEERGPTGALVEERTFSEFDLFEGTYIPRQITFRRPQESSNATIYYRELDLNPESLSFPFRVSASADRIPLG